MKIFAAITSNPHENKVRKVITFPGKCTSGEFRQKQFI